MDEITELTLGFDVGQWRVDPLKNSISRDAVTRHLENRLMQTLVFLAEHRNEVVARRDLFDSVWQGRVVNDEALFRAISLLRTALDDSAQNPIYIQTIPGVGYRLVADVKAHATSVGTPRPIENSIAVLPFVNLSDDPANEFFSDGVSEQILNSLAQVKDFKVVARTSSFAFRNKSDDLRKIGKILGVSHVLEGSVRKAGNTARTTAQLIKTDDGYHVWSQSFDHSLEDIFGVQDEISGAVALALQRHLLNPMEKSRETSPEIYSLYLQALYFLKPGHIDSIRKALATFQQVTELDPYYAPAWVGIADACWYLISYSAIDKVEALGLANAACARALEIDDLLADAHLCKATLALGFERDWAMGKSALDRALQLAPGSARVWLVTGNMHSSMGNCEQAATLLMRAQSLDPLNTTGHIWLSSNLIALDRLTDAQGVLEQGLELHPDRSLLHMLLGKVLLLRGELDLGYATILKEPIAFWRDYGIVTAMSFLGRPDEADGLMARLEANNRQSAPFQVAELHAIREDMDLAFKWLDLAFDERDNGLTELFVSPHLRPLRRDPRWPAFVTRMGL